jgi:hypothetical protein
MCRRLVLSCLADRYEEENATLKNHNDLPAWSFASVEALGEGDVRLCGCTNHTDLCNQESCTGGSTQNHHDVSLQGYRGKPVYLLRPTLVYKPKDFESGLVAPFLYAVG